MDSKTAKLRFTWSPGLGIGGAVMRIQWRLNDPTEGPYRWSRVHVVEGLSVRTMCGIIIPAHPYDQVCNENVAADALTCHKCLLYIGATGENQ